MERLTAFALQNKTLAIVLFIFLMGFGLWSFLNTPRFENPIVQPPGAGITIVYPGASLEMIEEQVVRPLEEALNELEDIDRLKSTIKTGFASTIIEFDFGLDADEKYREVQQQVNAAREKMPDEVTKVEVARRSTADVNIFQWNLVSETLPYPEMLESAEQFRSALLQIDGVKIVEIEGAPEEVCQISINPTLLYANNLTILEIEKAIKAALTDVPNGDIRIANYTMPVSFNGEVHSIEEVKNILISARNTHVIRLKDIADITYSLRPTKHISRLNGEKSIIIASQMTERRNIFEVANPIQELVEDFPFPDGVKLVTVFDQSKGVRKSLNSFLFNLLQGIVLVGAIVFIALGRSPTILIVTAIPLSIFIGFIAIDFTEYGLQQVSIAGLVVALGLLVDNAMAVTENIVRYREMGYDKLDAALKGTQELATPLFSATLTTCLAFIPIILMPDKAGAFISSMPVTVIATLIGSLLVAIMLTPILAKYIGKQTPHKTWFARKMEHFIYHHFLRILERVLARKRITLLIASTVFLGSLFLARAIPRSYFPDAEKPMFRILIDLPDNSHLAVTDEVVKQVETQLNSIESIEHYATSIGQGNPRIFFTANSKQNTSSYAEILVTLHQYDQDDFYELIASLQGKFDLIPDAQIEVAPFVQGVSADADIVIEIQGDNLDKLRTLSQQVSSLLEDLPGLKKVESELGTAATSVQFQLQREKAYALGINPLDIDKTIRFFTNGASVGQLIDLDRNAFRLMLGYKNPDSLVLKDYQEAMIRSHSGSLIPFNHIATSTFQPSLTTITHQKLERSVSVTADVEDGYALEQMAKSVRAQLEEVNWEGYQYTLDGELNRRNSSFGNMGQAALIACFAIFLVLVVQFQSITQPLIIFVALPLAIIGSFITLFIFQSTISFTTIVGLISLIGIAVNDSIILVDFANNDLKKGLTPEESAKNAAKVRFVPVLLTSITTIAGLIPLTLFGGDLWKPMGLTIIGGLTTSTLLILLVVPCLYVVFTKTKSHDKT